MKKLHCYQNSAIDTVVAYNKKDAIKVWEETTGEKYFDLDDGFCKISDDMYFTLYQEELKEGFLEPKNSEIVKEEEYYRETKAQIKDWIELCGRCFLGSTEY